jgi:hypothetical protein
VAERFAAIRPMPPEDPDRQPGRDHRAEARGRDHEAIDADLQAGGSTDVTARLRNSPRVVKQGPAE